jgi:acyl-CoA reductase-like NAD-dependent aldehyde dehydrogenase
MLAERYPYYLANRPLDGAATLDVTDKYTGAVATRVALADAAVIEQALAAGARAERSMRELPPYTRQSVLRRCADELRARSDALALALAIEAGKPIGDARGEVSRLIDTFSIAADEALRIDGEAPNLAISPRARDYRGFTRRVPVGLCSFITPFNFPLNLVAHKVAPAIAAGCPFVLKPSERTPVGALILGEVLAASELPPGAFSILPARLADVASFIEDPRVRLVSFTGSGKVGWDIKARAGRAKVVLELGGNAACIVDADQGDDLDHVVDRLVFGGYYQSGQSCISVQRVLVHRSLEGPLRERLVARVSALRSGDPKDEGTFLGPLIDEAAAKRLEAWVASAVRRGARVLTGGTRRGAFFDATVVEAVPPDEPLAAEEAFGPVVVLSAWDEFSRALDEVNDSPYGLQAGLFTHDLRHAMQAWDELEVGGVVVGDVPSFRVDSMPYGGVKGSGAGREGVRYAIADMTEPRLLVVRTPPSGSRSRGGT